MDYPRWKYAHDQSIIVHDEAEELALIGSWFDSPADVPVPVIVLSEDEQLLVDAKAEKEQLLAEALARGIAADNRWGIAKLKDALAL